MHNGLCRTLIAELGSEVYVNFVQCVFGNGLIGNTKMSQVRYGKGTTEKSKIMVFLAAVALFKKVLQSLSAC